MNRSPHKGKHATFVKNLLAITGCRVVSRAFIGLSCMKIIKLQTSKGMATCELCGTRFRMGALIKHKKTGARFTVGGVCARILQEKMFGDPKKRAARKRETWALFEEHYGDRETRGSWMKWMLKNCRGQLAVILSGLHFLEATRTNAEMRRLITYHDTHRAYLAAALLGDLAIYRELGIKVPRHLTIDQADRLEERIRRKPRYVLVQAEQLYDELYERGVFDHPDVLAAWEQLSEGDRLAVLAMIELSRCGRAIEASAFYKACPTLIPGLRVSVFVWNPQQGIAFVGEEAYRDDESAYLELVGTGKRSPYQLKYFRSVALPKRAVGALLRLAFQD